LKLEYFPIKKYELIRSEIKTGDILLCSGNGLFSQLIQDFTNSEWSHIGMLIKFPILDILMVAESMEGVGVRIYPLSKYLEKYDGKLAIFRHSNFNNDGFDESKLLRLVFERQGDKYDKNEIARIFFRNLRHWFFMDKIFKFKNKIVKNSKDICSEFIAYIFIKFKIEPPYSSFGVITPSDFAKWKELEFLYRLK
jgi:hypothetical protein